MRGGIPVEAKDFSPVQRWRNNEHRNLRMAEKTFAHLLCSFMTLVDKRIYGVVPGRVRPLKKSSGGPRSSVGGHIFVKELLMGVTARHDG